jgi:hypothetical protein
LNLRDRSVKTQVPPPKVTSASSDWRLLPAAFKTSAPNANPRRLSLLPNFWASGRRPGTLSWITAPLLITSEAPSRSLPSNSGSIFSNKLVRGKRLRITLEFNWGRHGTSFLSLASSVPARHPVIWPTPFSFYFHAVKVKPATIVTLALCDTWTILPHQKRLLASRILESTTNWKPSTRQIKHEHNNTFHRRMRLRRDSLPIHSPAGSDASLSLWRLPAGKRRAVFVFRHRAGGSFQALARLAPLSCIAKRKGRHDPPGVLFRMRRADGGQARCRSSICGDQNR